MKRLQQYSALMNQGELQDKQPIGKARPVVDSVVNYLLQEAEGLQNPKNTGVRLITFWEDVEEAEAAKVAADKAEAKRIADEAAKTLELQKKEAELDAKAKALADKEEALALQKVVEAAAKQVPIVKESEEEVGAKAAPVAKRAATKTK